jgi:hypothetical protein
MTDLLDFNQHQSLINLKEISEKKLKEIKQLDKIKKIEALEEAKALACSSELKITKTRSHRVLMQYPVCSIYGKKTFETINYVSADRKKRLSVTANSEHGLAKIFDFDVLRFCISKAAEASLHDSSLFPDCVGFSGYEIFKTLKKAPNKQNYEWLRESLTRLATTSYSGNIFTVGGDDWNRIFNLCSFEHHEKQQQFIVNFDDYIVQSARHDRAILVVDSDITHATSGLRKKLLEFVPVSIGTDKDKFEITLQRLKLVCNYTGVNKNFKRQLLMCLQSFPFKHFFDRTKFGDEKIVFLKKDQ